MSTKYILHGGSAQKVSSDNEKFFQEILKDTKNDLKILLVHFAIDSDKSEINKERDIFQFNNIKENKNISFEVATKDNFISQIINSDIIYFSGGVSTQKLLENLNQYQNLDIMFKDKIVTGESAGANILSTYCYSPASKSVLQGLGIVPVITVPHYQPGDEEKLVNLPKDLEILLLPNYQYKVFYI